VGASVLNAAEVAAGGDGSATTDGEFRNRARGFRGSAAKSGNIPRGAGGALGAGDGLGADWGRAGEWGPGETLGAAG
jgi:hypothetical protein